jgi:hypothetical protein
MEGSKTPTLPGVVATTFAGVIVGVAAVGYLFLKEVNFRPLGSASLGSVDLIVPVMAVDVGLVAAIPLLALYLRYHSAHDIGTGVLWVGLGLVAGGLLGVDLAVIYASARSYSGDAGEMGAEMGIAAAGFVVGIVVGGQAWLWTRRRYA